MRQTLHLSAALFGAILILLAGLNYYVHADLRQEAIAAETASRVRQAEIQAQGLENSLQVIVFSLRKLALQWQISGDDGMAMHRHLAETEAELLYVRALSIIDAQGMLVHSSRGHPAPRLDLSTRDNVAYHLGNGADPIHLSGPDRNLTDGRWQFSISMAVRDPGGRLRGILSTVIDPQIYATSFQRAAAPDDNVTLVTQDLRLVSRVPWREDAVGLPLVEADALKGFLNPARKAVSGVFDNPFTGEPRVVAGRRVFDDRLIIVTSRSLAAALQGWRALAVIVGGISVAIVLLGLGAIWFAARILADREAKARALADLNTELVTQKAQAEKAARVKGDFLATMSHEIRTPMNGVMGMAQVLEKMPLNAQARDYVSVIRESAGSLLQVIDDILDFSRIEAGQMRIEITAIRLTSLFDGLQALFAPVFTQKDVAFRTEIAPDAPQMLVTDHLRLRQILMNLVGNAAKFTASGHVILRARPSAAFPGRPGIRFEVEDTGIGIAPEAVDAIFERFAQEDTSTARKYGGTGLGLAISRRLCELLGGRIGCRSEKGTGSCFWVELPLETASHEETPVVTVTDNAVPAADGRMRVLYVDDNMVNRRIIDVLLKPFGCELALADSGAAGLKLAEQQAFDVVLLDIHMPEMDGFEVLRRLRRLRHGSSQRIVAVTADVVPEAMQRYADAGFDAVVPKPVVIGTLVEAMMIRQVA